MKDIYNNYKDLGLYNNGSFLVFSHKKVERIVSAIYIVTNLIKDSDPIKWELRDRSISLLSIIMSLNEIEAIDKNRLLQSFYNISAQIIPLIRTSFISGLISEMNSNILINEIDALVVYMRDQSKTIMDSTGYILSDKFFATDSDMAPLKNSKIKNDLVRVNSKGIEAQSDTNISLKDKKDKRRDTILSLLKESSNLSIKDFSRTISDCSEKTIQRELLELVDKGLIIKNGERRWSTYSLA